MATLSSALASSMNAACLGPAFNCAKRGPSAGVSHRIVWNAHNLAQSSYFSAQLSGHLLRQASAKRRFDIHSDTCKGTRHSLVRAQVKDNGNTPPGRGKEFPPAERKHLENKAEDRKDSSAENERLVTIGEGDDPEASGALSICLDAIGTWIGRWSHLGNFTCLKEDVKFALLLKKMDIDEMDECLALADSLNERKSLSS